MQSVKEELRLLDQIRSFPNSMTSKLIYAQWLDRRGEMSRARLIFAWCQWQTTKANHHCLQTYPEWVAARRKADWHAADTLRQMEKAVLATQQSEATYLDQLLCLVSPIFPAYETIRRFLVRRAEPLQLNIPSCVLGIAQTPEGDSFSVIDGELSEGARHWAEAFLFGVAAVFEKNQHVSLRFGGLVKWDPLNEAFNAIQLGEADEFVAIDL